MESSKPEQEDVQHIWALLQLPDLEPRRYARILYSNDRIAATFGLSFSLWQLLVWLQ